MKDLPCGAFFFFGTVQRIARSERLYIQKGFTSLQQLCDTFVAVWTNPGGMLFMEQRNTVQQA
jgi:hypothetical protein